jgi:hypothetical protein
MSSYTTKYRREHPEWREAEKIRNNERDKFRYSNDPEYREQIIKKHWKKALDRMKQ